MSTNIYQFNGSLLTTVSDGTLNTSAAPIAFPGKGYVNYGAPVLQDVLWTMQNFAGTSAPTPPLQGMLWYDTNAQTLKLYTGSAYAVMFKDNQDNVPNSNGAWDLGSSSYRFAAVYSNVMDTLTISTSNVTATSAHFGTVTMTGTLTGAPNLFYNNQTNVPTTDNVYNLGAAGLAFNTVYATTFNGTATQALYADVAERYAADAPMEIGDVVRIGGSAEITKTTADTDIHVFGVISDKPALQMNSAAGDDTTHPYVALLGRTPCKVIGYCGKGDRLVSSSTPGAARAADGGEDPHSIIGRALADKRTPDVGLVEIVIGRA